MSSLKLFIILGVAFLFGSVLLTLAVWYYFVMVPVQNAKNEIIELEETAVEVMDEAVEVAQEVYEDVNAVVSEEVDTFMESEPLIIDTTTLSETQRSVLEKVGVEGNEVVITEAMQQCAVMALGEERLAAIVAGDAPGILETAKLVSCYNE